MIFIHLFVFV